MREIEINVTAQDIENGKRCDSENDPLAAALHRAGFPHARVGFNAVYLDAGADAQGYLMPADACEFVRRHDSGRPVQPATFRLRTE